MSAWRGSVWRSCRFIEQLDHDAGSAHSHTRPPARIGSPCPLGEVWRFTTEALSRRRD